MVDKASSGTIRLREAAAVIGVTFPTSGVHVAYTATEVRVCVKDASYVAAWPVDCMHPGVDEEGLTSQEQLYIGLGRLECVRDG